MFTSIRARIVALCVAIVVAALMANAGLNYFISSNYSSDAVANTLTAVEESHVDGVADWVTIYAQMIGSLQDAVLQPDPVPALKQIAVAGSFTNVYVGYADKTAKFSNATGIRLRSDGAPLVQTGCRSGQGRRHAAVHRRGDREARGRVRNARRARRRRESSRVRRCGDG